MRGSISKILVVDDERIIADTLAAILSHAGFKSTAVYSGTDAVREASVITLNPAIRDQVKTGHREWPKT